MIFIIRLFQLFEYERLVVMLLHIVSNMDQVGFVQRIGIYLLNSLACQVDNYQKQLLGDLCAIDVSFIAFKFNYPIFVNLFIYYYLTYEVFIMNYEVFITKKQKLSVFVT